MFKLAPKKGATLFHEGQVLQKNCIFFNGECWLVYGSKEGCRERFWKTALDSLAEEAAGKDGLHALAVEKGKKAQEVLRR